jgi:riboflavin synthase
MTGAAGGHIDINIGPLAQDIKTGDSIAVNGICLTVTHISGNTVRFGVSPETVSKSTLPSLRPGSRVNIERALQVGDRLGGHFVQGHVDGTATIKKVQQTSDFWDIEFTVDQELLQQMVVKGSVAVDGISLTIAALHNHGFTVAVIPETLSRTTLDKIKTGQQVNIETDMIIKAIRRYLDGLLPNESTFSMEKLRQWGF